MTNTTTINYQGFDYTIVSTETAANKPNLRAAWNKAGIVDMVIVTGKPKRRVLTFGLYRQTDGTLREML